MAGAHHSGMFKLDLAVMVPISEHKRYAVPDLVRCLGALTAPLATAFFWHVNRSSRAFAEDLRAECVRAGLPFVMHYDATDYDEAAAGLRIQSGVVMADASGTASIQAIMAARQALRSGALSILSDDGYGLWIDADMLPPPDLFPRLSSHHRDVVAGRCHLRRADVATVAAWRLDPIPTGGVVRIRPDTFAVAGPRWLNGSNNGQSAHIAYVPSDARGVVEVDGVGLAATLMTPRALAALSFSLDHYISDDMLASAQLKAAGFPIFVDMDTYVPHVDSDSQVY